MKALRLGIYLLLTFAVLAFGGVEEWSQAVLEVGFSLLLVLWALRIYAWKQELILISPLVFPLAAFALVVLVQLLLHKTASTYDTRMQFQLLVAYLILMLLLPQAYYRMS